MMRPPSLIFLTFLKQSIEIHINGSKKLSFTHVKEYEVAHICNHGHDNIYTHQIARME